MNKSRVRQALAALATFAFAAAVWVPSASADQATYDYVPGTDTTTESGTALVPGDEIVGVIPDDNFATKATLVGGSPSLTIECDQSLFLGEITANGSEDNNNSAGPTGTTAEADVGDISFFDCRDTVPSINAISAQNISPAEVTAFYDPAGGDWGDAKVTIPDANPPTDPNVDFRISMTAGVNCDYRNSAGDIVVELDRPNQALSVPYPTTTTTVDLLAGPPMFCPGPTATFTADWEGSALIDSDSDGDHDDPAPGDLGMLD